MAAGKKLIKSAIKLFGETFTVGGTLRNGVFRVLRDSEIATYLTAAEAPNRPVYLAHVPYDDSTAAAATVTWNSLTLTVKRVIEMRLRNETVSKQLVLL